MSMEIIFSWMLPKVFYMIMWFIMDPIGRAMFIILNALSLFFCGMYLFNEFGGEGNNYDHEKMAYSERPTDPGFQPSGTKGKDESAS